MCAEMIFTRLHESAALCCNATQERHATKERHATGETWKTREI